MTFTTTDNNKQIAKIEKIVTNLCFIKLPNISIINPQVLNKTLAMVKAQNPALFMRNGVSVSAVARVLRTGNRDL